MTIDEQLREYRATLDTATEEAAASRARRTAPPIRIRPTRTVLVAAVAVAATVAVAFAAVGMTHERTTSPAGRGVTTTVSPPTTIGPPSTTLLPDVVGLNSGAAVAALEKFGFRATRKTVTRCVAPEGAVVDQDPAPGTRVAAASAVVIRVCTHRTSDRWTSRQLTITPRSLGAVRVGMTIEEAQTAAGLFFDGRGDGFWYSTQRPAGYPHDFVGQGGPSGAVVCVGAELFDASPRLLQTVSTPEGIRLGDTVQRLLSVYGSRARYVSAPASGMTTNAGYVVTESDGNLVFVVDRANRRIVEIAGGAADLGPNTCTG